MLVEATYFQLLPACGEPKKLLILFIYPDEKQ